MRSTIRDVAHKLNLSITTVSRALDGYPDVSAATREKVVQTAREMGYVPNRAARQLRRQRSDTIGYIIPASGNGFADAFFSEFIAGLGDEASANNFDLLVSTAAPNSPDECALYQRWVQGGKVDGMVVNRVRLTDWRLEFLHDQRVPHVNLERSSDQENFVGIEVDSYNGMLELVAHLINQGHSRIAYIGGGPGLKIDQDRRSGYQAGLSAAAVTPLPHLAVQTDLTSDGGYQAASRLLELALPPTAIVCINDMVAIGAMHAVHQAGLRVGRDIAVAGFDGINDSAHSQPPLTTLDQPVYSIARQLVQMLIPLVKGAELSQKEIILRPHLLVRASTTG
jgi:LacI family transcriptional regulator